LAHQATPTLNSGQYTYLKQGLYRDASIADVGVVYHDGMVMGTTLADVAPALANPPPAPDAGTPELPAPDAGTNSPVTPSPGAGAERTTELDLNGRAGLLHLRRRRALVRPGLQWCHPHLARSRVLD